MKFYQSRRADVAAAVLRSLESKDLPPMVVEGFVNGREQGLSLTNYHVRVSFSEDRSSDALVVYFGMSHDFSMQGNVLHQGALSDAAMRKHYSYPEDAADDIAEFIIINPGKFGIAVDENIPYPVPAAYDPHNCASA